MMVKKVNGFSVMPNELVSDGFDGDGTSFFVGETLEEAFENLIVKDEMWSCDKCHEFFSDEDEAIEHESEEHDEPQTPTEKD